MSRSLVGAAGRGAVIVIFTTVLGGCALLCAAGVLAQSAFQSTITAQRLAGADVVVAAPQTVDQDADLAVALPDRALVPASLRTELATLRSVTAAVGDLSFPAAVPGTEVDDVGVAGHGWSSANLLEGTSVTGRAPRTANQVAINTSRGEDWHLGTTIDAVVAGRPLTLTVTAIIRGGCNDGDVCGLYFGDHAAERLAGRVRGPKRGTVDLVALTTSGDQEKVAAQVQRLVGDDYEVLSGIDVGEAEVFGVHSARAFLLIVASSFSGVMILIVGFAVAGALAVSVAGQRRDLALLQAVGATPREVRGVIARQAMGSTLIALVPGTLLGYFLADRFQHLLTSHGLLPPRMSLSLGPLPAVAAAVLIAGTVRVAAWASSIGASRLSPMDAINEGEVEPQTPSSRRFKAGLLIILGSIPVAAVPVIADSQDRAAATAVAGLSAVIGLAFAGPSLLAMVAGAIFARASTRLPVMSWTALSNIKEHSLRSAGAVSALAMVVVFALTSVMSNTTVSKAAQDEVAAGVRADVAYAAPDLGGVPADLTARLRAAPGVEAAAPVGRTTVLMPYRDNGQDRVDEAPALALGPDASAVLDLGVTSGTLDHLTGSTIAVADGVAEVGATKDIILGDGTPVTALVVATYERELGFGPVVVSRALVRGHTTADLDSMVLVSLGPGARTPPAPLGVRHDVATAYLQSAQSNTQSWVNLAALAVLLGYVLISVANRLVATMTKRGAEFQTLQLVGATPRQLLRMVRIEAVVLAALAVAGGLVLAAIPLGFLGFGYLGRPWASGPGWITPAIGLLVFVISLTAHEVPARRLLKTLR